MTAKWWCSSELKPNTFFANTISPIIQTRDQRIASSQSSIRSVDCELSPDAKKIKLNSEDPMTAVIPILRATSLAGYELLRWHLECARRLQKLVLGFHNVKIEVGVFVLSGFVHPKDLVIGSTEWARECRALWGITQCPHACGIRLAQHSNLAAACEQTRYLMPTHFFSSATKIWVVLKKLHELN